ETKYVESCIGSAQSVMLVTSDYHTRRALAVFRKRLPNHIFYVAGASNPYLFGRRWWEHREWAKTTAMEWEKLLWWELVDSWRPTRG
ncbi:MAG: YdcF family protein, partial [Acidobacteria bacterium]|nr:YdcF family protein [Acidobacteriota bacterium]